MDPEDPLQTLLRRLELERNDPDEFVGASPPAANGRIFGGLVLAQGMRAAFETVEDRLAHSLHAYFLRPGDPEQPILYEVDRIRDGRSFTTRRVVARQSGQAILNMSVSFMTDEDGFEHQVDVEVPAEVEGAEYSDELRRGLRAAGMNIPDGQPGAQPVELRLIEPLQIFSEERYPPHMRSWLRSRGPLPDDPTIHQCVLAYASDLTVMVPAVYPHDAGLMSPGIHSASLDHAMWFHRPLRVDDWLYCVHESPVSARARGFGVLTFYTRSGSLVASCTQEGLIRRNATRPNLSARLRKGLS